MTTAAHVGDGSVVVEVVAVPVATEEADADVAEAIVDATVVADVGAPVAGIEAVATAVVAPVGRGPKGTIVGGRAPGAGNPVVAAITPGPVAGGPHVVGIGRGRLIVVGQGRRRLIGIVLGCVVLIVVVLIVVALIVVVLIVVALDNGGGLLLALIVFALLLRGVGGVGVENLGGLSGCGGEIAVGGIASGAVVDGCGGGCLAGAALATHGAEGEKRGEAGEAQHAQTGSCEGMFRHGRTNSRGLVDLLNQALRIEMRCRLLPRRPYS